MLRLFLLLLLSACAAPYYQRSTELMHEGNFTSAAEALKKADLPYRDCSDSPLFLLSRGMVNFQRQHYGSSARDFEKALDATDYYQQLSAPEIASQILIQDTLGAYVPPLFEMSLARLYQALAFLHLGDEDNAAATLYYLESHLSPHEQNPLTSYLLAHLLKRRGDLSNSHILLSRLHMQDATPSLLILHHKGQAPHKFSTIAPVSLVSVVLLEELLHTQNLRPALSTLTGIPVPALKKPTLPTTPLLINHQHPSSTLTYDIAKAAKLQLDHEMPLISTRAAARLLLRRGLVASANKHHTLADAAMLISNLATKADTRSWAALPAAIDLYALDLPPGEHLISIGGHSIHLQIPLKKLVVLEIFQPNDDNVTFSTQGIL